MTADELRPLHALRLIVPFLIERPPVRHVLVTRIHVGRIVEGIATIVRARVAWNIGIVGRRSPNGIRRIGLIRHRDSRVDSPNERRRRAGPGSPTAPTSTPNAVAATVPGRIGDWGRRFATG